MPCWSWDPDNPADYLAFGWWTQFPDQHPPNLSFEGSEQYAIADGPEIDSSIALQLPATGTATYMGQAGGSLRLQVRKRLGRG